MKLQINWIDRDKPENKNKLTSDDLPVVNENNIKYAIYCNKKFPVYSIDGDSYINIYIIGRKNINTGEVKASVMEHLGS